MRAFTGTLTPDEEGELQRREYAREDAEHALCQAPWPPVAPPVVPPAPEPRTDPACTSWYVEVFNAWPQPDADGFCTTAHGCPSAGANFFTFDTESSALAGYEAWVRLLKGTPCPQGRLWQDGTAENGWKQTPVTFPLWRAVRLIGERRGSSRREDFRRIICAWDESGVCDECLQMGKQHVSGRDEGHGPLPVG